MAATSKVNFLSNERLDKPDLDNIENFVVEDFNALAKYLLTSGSYVIGGFRPFQDIDVLVDNPTASPIYVKLAGSAVINTDAQGSAYMYVGSQKLGAEKVDLTENAINYIELDLGYITSSPDTRAFWDPQANSGNGAEFSQIVNTVKDLTAFLSVNQTGFSGGSKVPLMIVTMTGSSITDIEDARNLFFRLGRGNAYDDTYKYPWSQGREEPNKDRKEDSRAFTGADKSINTFKDWMDAIMTEIANIKGAPHWFDEGSSLIPGTNIINTWFDANGSLITGVGKFQHDVLTPGELTWSSPIYLKAISGDLALEISADTQLLQDRQVAYIELVRNLTIPQQFTFVNGSIVVTAPAGAFTTFSVGDWIKEESADVSCWRKIIAFSPVTPAFATSVTLDAPYTGSSAINKATRTQGVYSVSVDYPHNVPSSGDTYWIAKRDDNSSIPRIYLRGGSELEQGESVDISDNDSSELLEYVGTSDGVSTPKYSSALVTGQTEISTFTLPHADDVTSGQYHTLNAAGDIKKFYVWFNKDGAGGDPSAPGRYPIEVAISAGMPELVVAAAWALAVSAESDFIVTDNNDGTVTVENVIVGSSTNAANVDVGGLFSVVVDQEGIGTPNRAIIDDENLTRSMKRLDGLLGTIEDSLGDLTPYEEAYEVVLGATIDHDEIEGPIPAGTIIRIPKNSRKSNIQQDFVVGYGDLGVYLNGVRLLLDFDWTQVGAVDTLSSDIQLTMDLIVGDFLSFKREPPASSLGGISEGSVYTGANAGVVADGDIFKAVAGQTFQFRRLKAGPNVTITQQSDTVTITSSPGVALSNVTTHTNNHSVSFANDIMKANTTTGNITFTLPDATTCSGKVYHFKKIVAANSMILKSILGQNLDNVDIDSSPHIITDENEAISIFSDGAQWWIV